MIGSRKTEVTREMALLLLAGFIIAVWMRAPTEIYVSYVLGLSAKAGAFMWGNAQEHRSKKVDSLAGQPV